MTARLIVPVLLTLLAGAAFAAEMPQEKQPDKVKRIPAPGIQIAAADLQELMQGAEQLGKKIDGLRALGANRPEVLDLLPDVQIFHNAVRYACAHDEFYDQREVNIARSMLKMGMERASQLEQAKPTWPAQSGLVVRGYLSKIDASVQPYGLVVPESYASNPKGPFRLDFWCHGRDEKLTELRFLDNRMKSKGEFTPPGAFVLHLYGRYCCANKFAGDVDMLEAFDHACKHYPIDLDRVVMRGFSMGGGACWQFATHYPGLFAATAPGAGFAETPEFLNNFRNEKIKPTWYEQKLWRLYNSSDYAVNLFNLPTVAYSGEIDGQKQAADVMARELKKEGLELVHIIGPKTGHKYHPDSKVEINKLIDEIVAKGRDPLPERIRFTTWTLRYNRSHWIQVDALGQHWERARVDAIRSAPGADGVAIKLETQNVEALTIDMPAGRCPYGKDGNQVKLVVDGTSVLAAPPVTERPWIVHLSHLGGKWQIAPATAPTGLAKRHGLQGPIDDAFYDRFIMVRPTGQAQNEKTGKWVSTEMAHAIDHWRRQFRGEALVKDDSAITDADIAASNLVLWGDAASNKILAKIAGKLPIAWTAREITVGDKKYDAGHHAVIMVFPNPLNPKKYVVLNSGFTFREYDYLNNARQVPKLPDFAVVDVNIPPNSRSPGEIVTAGLFTESWGLATKATAPE
jgi:hypothetical protein